MRSLVLKVTLLSIALVLGYACLPKKSADSELLRAEIANEGRLWVIADDKITGGHIDYKIYDNGVIVYNGEVSYLASFDDFIEVEFQPLFSGKYRLKDKRSVFSENYNEKGEEHTEYLTTFKVDKIDAENKLSHMSLVADQKEKITYNEYNHNTYNYEEKTRWEHRDNDAVKGKVIADISKAIISLKYVELTGDTNTPLGKITIKLSDKMQ